MENMNIVLNMFFKDGKRTPLSSSTVSMGDYFTKNHINITHKEYYRIISLFEADDYIGKNTNGYMIPTQKLQDVYDNGGFVANKAKNTTPAANNQIEKRLLTYKEKDILLDCLVSACNIGEDYVNCNFEPICDDTGLSAPELHALFQQFNEYSLLDYAGHIHYTHKVVSFKLKQNAVDFKLHGGFQMKEEIFDIQMSKLLNEIDKLKEEGGDSLEKYANLITIATGLTEISKEVFHIIQ